MCLIRKNEYFKDLKILISFYSLKFSSMDKINYISMLNNSEKMNIKIVMMALNKIIMTKKN